ncbi:MAG: putative metal-binding motif-containing protein [Pseudomonadota bacterium]
MRCHPLLSLAVLVLPACSGPPADDAGVDLDADGYAVVDGDCDDHNDTIHPGADERCDGVDDDCDGAVDEEDAVDAATFCPDRDGDGWGDPATTTRACAPAAGQVVAALALDCDDADAGVFPGADEHCDGVDEDCDGAVDEGAVNTATFYTDADGDGFGDAAAPVLACAVGAGQSAEAGDCDDADPGVSPASAELCNGLDDDCDGSTDEDDATDAPAWYADGDGDGYGDDADPVYACAAPAGRQATGGDCDDGDPAVHPGAVERCDGVDDDCSGIADEGCEICDSGSDEDADGLVDCEDADCFDAPACLEAACSDGLDDDGDGLTDCEDDDCWGPICHPAGVRSRVQGGTMLQNLNTRHVSAADSMRCDTGSAWTWDYGASIYALWGTVQVLPSGASAWGSTAARTTCTWSVVAAQVGWERWVHNDIVWHSSGWRLEPVNRIGFAVDPACRLGSSWFLPSEVAVMPGAGYAGVTTLSPYAWSFGPRFYAGSELVHSAGSTHSSRNYVGPCDWSGSSRRTRGQAWHLGPSGETYTATP